MKIEENYLILKDNFFISSERLEEIRWNFLERCVLKNMKSHKKPEFRPLLRRYIFQKTTE